MKRSAWLSILLWIVVILLLTSILIWGLAGFPGWHSFPSLSFDLGSHGNTYADSSRYSVGSAQLTDPIQDLSIDWLNGSVTVNAYDGDTIQIYEPDGIEPDFQLRYLVENGKLLIRYAKSGLRWSLGQRNPKDLTVALPRAVAASLDTMEIDNVSAAVCISDCTTKTFTLDSVSGGIELSNITAEKVELETVSGSITASGTFHAIAYETVSGDVSFDSAVCPTKVDGSSVSGEATLHLPADSGFTLDYDKVSGQLRGDFSYTTDGKRFSCGQGGTFDISTVSGDLNILKR